MLELDPRRVVAVAAFAALTLAGAPALAQVHWDASAQVGVMKRFLASRPPAGDDAGFGPAAQLTAHVALLPLVRLGGYVGHDISPLGDTARDVTWGGARVKVMSPWPRGALRAWLFAGFGYAGVYQRSYETTLAVPTGLGRSTTSRDVTVQGAGGGFFEVPFGIGVSYKLRRPWQLCAELGGRVGFGHSGSVYEAPGPQASSPGVPDDNVVPAGLDRFALGLTVGVMVDL